MGKAFGKQIKTIKDQGQKQIDALKSLKPKEQTKPIEDKSNKKSKAAIIFDDLINKRKGLMKELYDSVDYNNLKFEFVGPTKDVNFYEYMDSKELFNAIKNYRISFDDALKKQNELLNKISNVKIGKKADNQKEVINNPENFYISREEVFNFFRDCGKMVLDATYKSKQNETKGQGLKILTPKQTLQRLPIALAQVGNNSGNNKAGNNSESLLKEIKQIVYSLYQQNKLQKEYTAT